MVLRPAQVAQILILYYNDLNDNEEHYSYHQIADIVGCVPNTVRNWVHKWEHNNRVTNIKPSGRSRKTTEFEDHSIV
jgi:uncharacterized protein YjcR